MKKRPAIVSKETYYEESIVIRTSLANISKPLSSINRPSAIYLIVKKLLSHTHIHTHNSVLLVHLLFKATIQGTFEK